MSSRRGGGRVSHGGAAGDNSSLSKDKGIDLSISDGNCWNISRDVADLRIEPAGDRDGDWEVYSRKPKNRNGGNAGKALGSSNNAQRSWVQLEKQKGNGGGCKPTGGNLAPVADPRKQTGRGKPASSTRNWEAAYMAPAAPPPAIPPPLQHGWQWQARSGSCAQEKPSAVEKHMGAASPEHHQQVEDISDEDDSDCDFSDDYDSDPGQKSFETRKNNRWFKSFFEALDKLTAEQINEASRQWHCAACSNGPGAIDWYKGLQPLMTHAKTKGSSRVKLHRDFAELLEEELQRRGTSVIPAGEVFGKWKGLRETADHEIVWPPMVVVMNTILDQDDNDRWVGMGNQELLEYFHDYAAQKARHSYGPSGHRGMSVLIFAASAVGYMEAERLHKHFTEQGTDREAWRRKNKPLFSAGGKRQLYGFLACKEDLDIFNHHCQGKTKLKFEMKSYQERVVSEMRQMHEDNQQLAYCQNQLAKKRQCQKTLEQSLGDTSRKLHETKEEIRIVRERTTEQFEENKLEMDYQDKFFKEHIAKATKEKEERTKAHKTGEAGTEEEFELRQEVRKFIDSLAEGGGEEFKAAIDVLMQLHKEKKAAMRLRHLEEEEELNKEFDAELTKLKEKYASSTFEASSN